MQNQHFFQARHFFALSPSLFTNLFSPSVCIRNECVGEGGAGQISKVWEVMQFFVVRGKLNFKAYLKPRRLSGICRDASGAETHNSGAEGIPAAHINTWTNQIVTENKSYYVWGPLMEPVY